MSSLGNQVDFSRDRVDFHLLVAKLGKLFGKLSRNSGNRVDFSGNWVGFWRNLVDFSRKFGRFFVKAFWETGEAFR